MTDQLQCTIIEPEKRTQVLDKDNCGIIEPTKLHQVKALSDDLEFVVEFLRVPDTGAVDEKRDDFNITVPCAPIKISYNPLFIQR